MPNMQVEPVGVSKKLEAMKNEVEQKYGIDIEPEFQEINERISILPLTETCKEKFIEALETTLKNADPTDKEAMKKIWQQTVYLLQAIDYVNGEMRTDVYEYLAQFWKDVVNEVSKQGVVNMPLTLRYIANYMYNHPKFYEDSLEFHDYDDYNRQVSNITTTLRYLAEAESTIQRSGQPDYSFINENRVMAISILDDHYTLGYYASDAAKMLKTAVERAKPEDIPSIMDQILNGFEVLYTLAETDDYRIIHTAAVVCDNFREAFSKANKEDIPRLVTEFVVAMQTIKMYSQNKNRDPFNFGRSIHFANEIINEVVPNTNSLVYIPYTNGLAMRMASTNQFVGVDDLYDIHAGTVEKLTVMYNRALRGVHGDQNAVQYVKNSMNGIAYYVAKLNSTQFVNVIDSMMRGHTDASPVILEYAHGVLVRMNEGNRAPQTSMMNKTSKSLANIYRQMMDIVTPDQKEEAMYYITGAALWLGVADPKAASEAVKRFEALIKNAHSSEDVLNVAYQMVTYAKKIANAEKDKAMKIVEMIPQDIADVPTVGHVPAELMK